MADARRAAAELERTAGLGFVGAMVYARRCYATRWK
jgi:hypothetical protein